MNCSKCERLLWLYVEGDLAEPRRRLVEVHLASCTDCERLLQRACASQAWLKDAARSEPDAEFDYIRRAVLAEIRSSRPRRDFLPGPRQWNRSAWNSIAAVAAVAALIIAVTLSVILSGPQRRISRKVAGTTRKDSPQMAKPGIKDRPSEKELKHGTFAKTRPNSVARRRIRSLIAKAPHPQHVIHSVPAELADTALTENSPIRVEIQTSDPNVRIIWFARNNDSATSKPEEKTR